MRRPGQQPIVSEPLSVLIPSGRGDSAAQVIGSPGDHNMSVQWSHIGVAFGVPWEGRLENRKSCLSKF